MADLINATNDEETPGIDTKSLADTLQKSRKNVEALEQLSNDPKYAQGVPPDTRASLQQAINQAKELYNQQSTKNDWLEVAQTLGRAVTQFGAARAGQRSGADMSNLNMGPTIDYNARNERAFRDYTQSAKQAGEMSDLERQRYQEAEKAKQEEYGRKSGAFKEGAQVYDTQAKTMASELGANARNQRFLSAEDRKRDEADRRAKFQADQMEVKDLGQENKSIEDRIKAKKELATNLQMEGDLSKKGLDKLQEKYGQLAGRAGVDLTEVQQKYEKEVPKAPRTLFGHNIPFTEKPVESEAPKTLARALGLEEDIQKLQSNRSRQKDLIRGLQGGQAASQPATASAPSGPRQDPKISDYAQQHSLDYNKAKDILISRGYKPAE